MISHTLGPVNPDKERIEQAKEALKNNAAWHKPPLQEIPFHTLPFKKHLSDEMKDKIVKVFRSDRKGYNYCLVFRNREDCDQVMNRFYIYKDHRPMDGGVGKKKIVEEKVAILCYMQYSAPTKTY